MQTVEQRIARLDKRIAMFENYLQSQHLALMIKYTNRTTFEKIAQLIALDMNLKQFYIIASQRTPSFPKGCFINECGPEIIKSTICQ